MGVDPNTNIAGAVNDHMRKVNKDSKERLFRVIEAVKFLGRYGLPLRDSRDSGKLGANIPDRSEGLFQALLFHREEWGDVKYKELLQTATERNQFTSHIVQNYVLSAELKCVGYVALFYGVKHT